MTGPAPRAPSRLAPTDDEPASKATDNSSASAVTRHGYRPDPVDAMIRALVDQAWLRGVDLR